MNRTVFFLILFYIVQQGVAQSLAPVVLSSAGSSFTNSSNQLDWTLGEPATSTLNDGTDISTQGFHQSNLNITSVDNFDTNFGITVFPNPAIDLLHIQFEKINENNLIELYTSDGKLILTQSAGNKILCQIDMDKFDNGTYLVKIYNKNTLGKSYRIVKLK